MGYLYLARRPKNNIKLKALEDHVITITFGS